VRLGETLQGIITGKPLDHLTFAHVTKAQLPCLVLQAKGISILVRREPESILPPSIEFMGVALIQPRLFIPRFASGPRGGERGKLLITVL
jgi:hypothetical protein